MVFICWVKNLSVGACLFVRRHPLSQISKLASFLLASASRAPLSASSSSDSSVSVLLLGLANSGGAGGQHVWSVRDESTSKTPVRPVFQRSRSYMFYLVAVILGMEIFAENMCGKEVDFHGCRHRPPPRGWARLVEGWLQLSPDTREGLLGNWADVSLSKQHGQNKAKS